MEYNNKKTIGYIRDLLFLIESDVTLMSENIRLEANAEDLEMHYRTCELMEDYIERAKTLIGKILDEREDMGKEGE